jgi:large repetitive protein
LTAGTATAGTDDVDSSGAIVGFFCIGTCPTTSTISVQVNGDTDVEPNETFTITLTSGDFAVDPTKSSATGTIVNDDALLPNLSINTVSLNEGNAGTTTFTFTVSLSAPAGPGGVTFDIATDDDYASAPPDYTPKSLVSQTIPAGGSTYTFSVS